MMIIDLTTALLKELNCPEFLQEISRILLNEKLILLDRLSTQQTQLISAIRNVEMQQKTMLATQKHVKKKPPKKKQRTGNDEMR
jgi:hypothetical protein